MNGRLYWNHLHHRKEATDAKTKIKYSKKEEDSIEKAEYNVGVSRMLSLSSVGILSHSPSQLRDPDIMVAHFQQGAIEGLSGPWSSDDEAFLTSFKNEHSYEHTMLRNGNQCLNQMSASDASWGGVPAQFHESTTAVSASSLSSQRRAKEVETSFASFTKTVKGLNETSVSTASRTLPTQFMGVATTSSQQHRDLSDPQLVGSLPGKRSAPGDPVSFMHHKMPKSALHGENARVATFGCNEDNFDENAVRFVAGIKLPEDDEAALFAAGKWSERSISHDVSRGETFLSVPLSSSVPLLVCSDTETPPRSEEVSHSKFSRFTDHRVSERLKMRHYTCDATEDALRANDMFEFDSPSDLLEKMFVASVASREAVLTSRTANLRRLFYHALHCNNSSQCSNSEVSGALQCTHFESKFPITSPTPLAFR